MRVQLDGLRHNATKGMREWSLAQVDSRGGRTGVVILLETEPGVAGVFAMGRTYNVEMVEQDANLFHDDTEDTDNDAPAVEAASTAPVVRRR